MKGVKCINTLLIPISFSNNARSFRIKDNARCLLFRMMFGKISARVSNFNFGTFNFVYSVFSSEVSFERLSLGCSSKKKVPESY